uniref:Ycf80 n=1 Tax=Polysiphonia sp. TaxID=1967842 RepID=A0A1Z1M3S6_9FLOR|nr:hypothetical protein [Polysiphonia sp.]
MILFNLILVYKLVQNYSENRQLCQWDLRREYLDVKSEYLNKNSSLNNANKILLSKNQILNDKVYSNLFISEIDNNKFINRDLWRKLINKYIQETLFLSSSNTLSTSYVSKLRASGISVYKGNEYKNFLYRFNKDLVNGKINVTINNLDYLSTSISTIQKNIYLKYKWSKFLNFKNLFSFMYKKDRSNTIKRDISHLFNFSIPLFVIVNNHKEIVLSESSDQLSKGRAIFNFCSHFIKQNSNTRALYTGLLFINPQDALEYKQYIQSKYSRSTHLTHIQVIPANIYLYYKLMTTLSENIEFRLIPDLKEISNLIYKYKKYKNISFTSKQKYSHNSFQGQPLYFIKPLYVKKKYSQYTMKVDYLYNFEHNGNYSKHNAGFLNYNTLIGAWKKFKEEYKDYNFPSIPEVSVSNFETFIQNESFKKNYTDTIFLPSLQAYNFVKGYINTSYQHKQQFKSFVLNKSLYLKTFCFRIFWSLTSRQPINW